MKVHRRRARPKGRSVATLLLLLAVLASAGLRARCCAQELRAPLLRAPKQTEAVATPAPLPRTDGPARPDLSAWWDPYVKRPLARRSVPLPMSIEGAVISTLAHSPQVRIISDAPLIRRAAIIEAESRFDVRNFIESKFVDTSDPVGSTLTTGGAGRFVDQNWTNAAGLRRRTYTGAQFEASQRIGYEDNNSIFFVPTEQGTARLTLSVTQPLLNGRGRAYNTSLIVLAEIDANIARDQLARDLQLVLLDVHRAYWELYVERAALLQRRRLYQEATTILGDLDARRQVDVTGSQVVRARAAVANREAATIRFATQVRNAEARLRTLIGDPQLIAGPPPEIIPSAVPLVDPMCMDLQQSLVVALQNRPEIALATKEIRAASIRADVAQHELLPVLNLILGTYVSGLEGDSGIIPAFGDQFSTGRPTYSGGLVFDAPYGNRAAQARLLQRRLEMRQVTNQLRATTANVRAEVEVAVREVTTTYREMVSRRQAMAANQAEIDYLLERWRMLPGDQQVTGIVLDDVLKAQERLADASFDFVSAQAAYNVALVNVKRVTGTLLDCEAIGQGETSIDCLPTLIHDKQLSAPMAAARRPNQPTPAATAPQIRMSSRIEQLPRIR